MIAYISGCLESFLAFGPFFLFTAKYSIVAFIVELIRLKCGKKPCRNHWRLVLIGFLAIIALYAFGPLLPDAVDAILSFFLLSYGFTALMLWFAVGVTVAKVFCHPEA